MNLVGKIFTVLIFVMCIVFSSFALMLHAGHKNWRDEYVKQTAQLDKANEEKSKLEQANKLLDQQRKSDNDRDKKLIGKLQATNDLLTADNLAANTKVLQLQADQRKVVTDFKLVEQNLADIRGEAESLRENNKLAVSERQEIFDKYTKAVTDVATLGAEIDRFQKQFRELADQYNKARMLAQYTKVQESDMQKDPPSGLSGLVTGVQQSDVEISLGYDDGVRVGHRFAVLRPSNGNQLVGDIVVTRVDYPNRAVARAVKETMRDQIQKYDHVQASLTKRPEISRAGR
jgi:hypothetical protein